MQFAKSSELCYNIKPTKGELVMNEAINATKKINLYKDRNNLYSESLSFSVRQNNSVDNLFYTVEDYDENEIVRDYDEFLNLKLSSGD